jgi:hypothetical protein
MFFRFLGLKKTLPGLAVCVLAVFSLLSCSGSSTSGSHPSGLPLRAFVSNPDSPSAIGHGPVLNIMDASRDFLSTFVVNLASLGSSVTDAGMMALSPKQDRTIVVSPLDSRLAIVNNSAESLSGAVTLPGPTQSVFVWTDNRTAFAAVPTATVPGAAEGAVVMIDIAAARITDTIPIPLVRYVAASPNGNQILAFSDNSNLVSVIDPSLVGVGAQTPTQPCSSTPAAICTVSDPSLDHPIGAVFNSTGTTAYIISCGPECGGSAAAISVLDLGGGSTPPAFTGQVALIPGGATTALLHGTTLYVAGTPPAPQNSCGTGVPPPPATATTCGQLTLVNTTTMIAATSVQISDGTHVRIEMGANAQLFLGSVNCTASTCLNIVDTSSGSVTQTNVVWTIDGGNVTGIAPIPSRSAVYVCVGGRLRVYDTTTDKQLVIPSIGQPDIVGQAVDVKVPDF